SAMGGVEVLDTRKVELKQLPTGDGTHFVKARLFKILVTPDEDTDDDTRPAFILAIGQEIDPNSMGCEPVDYPVAKENASKFAYTVTRDSDNVVFHLVLKR